MELDDRLLKFLRLRGLIFGLVQGSKTIIFEEEMKSVAERYDVSIWPVYFDMNSEAEIKAAIQSIRKQNLNVDVLANIAGVMAESSNFHMTSMDKMKHVLEVNFFPPHY